MVWTSVKIAEVAQKIDRSEKVQPDKKYTLLGMRSKIGGPFARETKAGAEISAQSLNRVATGDFIYSRLFAWQGSFGMVPEELDGCYVSNEFPLFEIDISKIEIKFLVYWFGLLRTQKAVEQQCHGSTPSTRNRFKENFFFGLDAPLPPLDEQRDIVQRLDRVTGLIESARNRLDIIASDRRALAVALARRSDLSNEEKLQSGWTRVTLDDVLRPSAEPVQVSPDSYYPNLGIYSYARGVFAKPPIDGAATSARVLYRVRADQFIYSRLFAFEGAFAIVPEELEGAFVSNEFPSFDILPSNGAAFLRAYFSDTLTWQSLLAGSLGLGSRRQRVNEKHLLKHQLWLPPETERTRLTNVFSAMDRATNYGITEETNALMPALLHEIFCREAGAA